MPKRQPTQPSSGWPFLLTYVPGRGLVQNVPGKPRIQAKRPSKPKGKGKTP